MALKYTKYTQILSRDSHGAVGAHDRPWKFEGFTDHDCRGSESLPEAAGCVNLNSILVLRSPLQMVGISGIRLLAASCALLATASAGSAQTKIAIINLQRAVLESAEIKKASAELEAKYKPKQQAIEKLQREIQAIQQNLQTNAGKLTQQAEADLTAQGQRKQRELTRQTEDLQADVERERNEILGRSSQRMQEVVKKLAEEKGLDVVVDVSNTVYFKPGLEITTESIAAYDKAYPAK